MYQLNNLPPKADLESKEILKKAARAHRYLAELKGISQTIPNQNILINSLGLQEAKDSSAIENIITTQDELFKLGLFKEMQTSPATKEVQNYAIALKKGFQLVQKSGMLTSNTILEIQSELVKHKAGYRKLPGTELKNNQTGETVYTPPQNADDILRLMNNLEKYINDDHISPIDPLIKMAVIHHQFESIHPFYDGNGRTGRILNILYLVQKKLLNIPVLYLSRYIIKNKNDYYRLLQAVRDREAWEEWILFILAGIEQTSRQTIHIILKIRELMMAYKHEIRQKYRFYSQDLLNNLFFHPYTKIDFLKRDLNITRITATKYLNELVDGGFLKKKKMGNSIYYINHKLFNLFIRVPEVKDEIK